ncbi:Protein trapped in endoderm-1 [Pseudolycoriella hygida]|uniref:Protein trapped in endoderm-1 n=1 Tax=Pseudolycoriella hygida TaxID=35572 RepID=A0A9Q0MR11_9DIPT|nr:Protein trapped in endoderm-1 [Pseudolycoriella hygida]
MTSTEYAYGATVGIVYTIVGFSGNFLTLIALLRDRVLRQHVTTVFIMSLCISDLIYSSTCFPASAAAYLNNELMSNIVVCKLYASSLRINLGNTTFSIAGIAINRFILVVHPHLYKSFYQKSMIIGQLLIIWLLPVALLIPPLTDQLGTIEKLNIFCVVAEKDGKSIENVLFVVGLISPCLIITVSYGCIFYKVRQQCRKMSQCNSSQEKERHLTMMTLLIYVSFVVCCLPMLIEHIWFYESESLWPNLIVRTFGGALAVINPFIYAATNHKYRATYCDLFNGLKICGTIQPDFDISTGKSDSKATTTTNSTDV